MSETATSIFHLSEQTADALGIAVAFFPDGQKDPRWMSPAFAQWFATHATQLTSHIKSKDNFSELHSKELTCSGQQVRLYTHRQDDGFFVRVAMEPNDREATIRYLSDRESLYISSRSHAITEMAATMSHELNQPLASISNLINALSIRAAKPETTPSDLIPIAEKALSQVGYASGLIGRMREYTDALKPVKQDVHISEIITKAVDLLEWEILRYNISVYRPMNEGSLVIHVDPIMLQQVIVNLMRNAIESMRDCPASQRELRLEMQETSRTFDIIIEDSGAGLSDSQSNSLFTPFQSTKQGGMGMGLNICRSILELHNGSLWHEPAPRHGARFHISFPLSALTDNTPEEAQEHAANLPR
ncbi:MAG: sensor histidine kinase [Hyphomonas sp.]